MKRKLKKVFTNFRVVIVLICLLFAAVAIFPNPARKGVAIRNVLSNSSASRAGIVPPKPTSTPMAREVILSIDNMPIRNTIEYYDKVASLRPNSTVHLHTNKKDYSLRLGENVDLGLVIYNAPTSNIRKGLDMEGGTRVLLQPAEKLSQDDTDMLIDNMKQRLNVYGLSDLIIREANDLAPPLGTGNQYIVVEIAGATKEEVSDLLAKQGKFEAKIGNESVFIGGQDIKSVCRSADCAGIDPNHPCGQAEGGWVCGFRFSITLSTDAAERQADITKDVPVIAEGDNKNYLEEKLILYLDDAQVDELNIAADLKGRAVTDISISGSGSGASQQEAVLNTLKNMKRLQTILLTGSLPVKIDIVKTDAISPVLGEEFIKNAIILCILAFLAVIAVIFARYRKLNISLSMLIVMFTEVILILGAASLIGWNLDLAAIAGIILVIGTGVDDLAVITDEILGGDTTKIYDWKKRIKKAFFIVMGAYTTTVVAMLPLMTAGAGLLKGFAITTIIGVSIGVFITRPAYAAFIEILLKD